MNRVTIPVELQPHQIEKKHKTEEKGQQSCFPHDLVRMRVMRSILKYNPEVYLISQKPISIEGKSPDVEDQQPHSSEHWYDVCHWVDVVVVLVELDVVQNQDQPESYQDEES